MCTSFYILLWLRLFTPSANNLTIGDEGDGRGEDARQLSFHHAETSYGECLGKNEYGMEG